MQHQGLLAIITTGETMTQKGKKKKSKGKTGKATTHQLPLPPLGYLKDNGNKLHEMSDHNARKLISGKAPVSPAARRSRVFPMPVDEVLLLENLPG